MFSSPNIDWSRPNFSTFSVLHLKLSFEEVWHYCQLGEHSIHTWQRKTSNWSYQWVGRLFLKRNPLTSCCNHVYFLQTRRTTLDVIRGGLVGQKYTLLPVIRCMHLYMRPKLRCMHLSKSKFGIFRRWEKFMYFIYKCMSQCLKLAFKQRVPIWRNYFIA